MDRAASQVRLDSQDLRELKEKLVHLGQLVLQVQWEIEVPKDQLEALEFLAHQRLEQLVQLALQAQLAPQDQPVLLASQDKEVQLEHRGNLVHLDQKEIEDKQEQQEK